MSEASNLPPWYERAGLKLGADFNSGLRTLFGRVEAIEARLAKLEDSTGEKPDEA